MKDQMSINHEKLKERGMNFESWSDMYYYVQSLVEWLESHNKNYNKEQYHKIVILKEILESIDCGV